VATPPPEPAPAAPPPKPRKAPVVDEPAAPADNRAGVPEPAHLAPASPEAQSAMRAGRAIADPRAERDVWVGRYSAKALALHFIGLAMWTVLALVIAYYAGGPALLWIILILGPALIVFGRLGYSRWTIKYRLTTQRLFHTYGLLVQRVDEMELVRMDDVTLEQNLIERIFDVGTLIIDSTDKSEPRKYLKGITRPREVKEFIRNYAAQLRQGLVRVHNI
jgi:hypothetical protein